MYELQNLEAKYEQSQCMTVAQLNNRKAFPHDVTAAIMPSQNNETAAMLSQTDPVGVVLSFIPTK